MTAEQADVVLAALEDAFTQMQAHCLKHALPGRADILMALGPSHHLVQALRGDEFCAKVHEGELAALDRALADMKSAPVRDPVQKGWLARLVLGSNS